MQDASQDIGSHTDKETDTEYNLENTSRSEAKDAGKGISKIQHDEDSNAATEKSTSNNRENNSPFEDLMFLVNKMQDNSHKSDEAVHKDDDQSKDEESKDEYSAEKSDNQYHLDTEVPNDVKRVEEMSNNGFSVPFIKKMELYESAHLDRESGNKYAMHIAVSSASTCKILEGSYIYADLKGTKISRDARETLERIKTKGKIVPVENGRLLRLIEDVPDVKVATAATLLFGRSESSRVFKNTKTGEFYTPTRNKTPQNTSELETYIFDNT